MNTIRILGGGLWGGLLAHALQKYHPATEFELIEKQATLGGNHTWSFHLNDLSEEEFELIAPFIVKSWNSYDVKFPAFEKTVPLSYASISSEQFHRYLIREIPERKIRLQTHLSLTDAGQYTEMLVDAKGAAVTGPKGYQKFMGLEIETETPHGLMRPLLMDAAIDQIDGFRFLYYLPFSDTKLLIEDTRYSSTSFLDHFRTRAQLEEVIRRKNWQVKRIIREEYGALPIPFYFDSHGGTEIISLQGIFHDTTGYSLPDACRLIMRLMKTEVTKESWKKCIHQYRLERKKDREFFCLLNRLMFFASDEKDRYKTLEYFYRSKKGLISRFYSGKMTGLDRISFFLGKPPVPVARALDVIFHTQSIPREEEI